MQQAVTAEKHGQLGVELGGRSRPAGGTSAAVCSVPAAPVKISRRSRSMARTRSLTEPYIVSRAPDKIAAVVMSTTGATIAWIAVTAIGFINPSVREQRRTEPAVRVRPAAGTQSRSVFPAPAASASLRAL